MPVLRYPCAVILTAPAPSNYRRNSPAVPYRALKSHAPTNPIPSPALRPLAHGRRPSRQIPSRPPKGNPARPSKSRGETGRKCGEFADRHLGEHAIRSAKWERGRASRPRPSADLWWVAPRLGNRALLGWRERSDRPPRWGERRAIGGRKGGRGSGEEIGTGREGSVFISSRSFF